MSVRVVTDSTADLPPPVAEELGIVVVPLNVHFGDDVYRDGVDLQAEEFFRRLQESSQLPTTSQPSVGAFIEVYGALAKETDEVLSVHISSKLSGTLNSAILARDSFEGDCRVEIVDSLLTSMGLGMVALRAARAANAGGTLAEVAAEARAAAERTRIYLLVDTLEYLRRGGRIGGARALLGTLLNVKPVLTVRDGEVQPLEQVRTRAKATERLIELAGELGPVEMLSVVHSTTPEDARSLASRVESACSPGEIFVTTHGCIIGTHLGPGALGAIVLQKA